MIDVEHMKYRVTRSRIRYVYIGSQEDNEYKEIVALSKMSRKKIYYTRDVHSLSSILDKSTIDSILPYRFVRIDIKYGRVIPYGNSILSSIYLYRFIFTSSLRYPEQFSYGLTSELYSEGMVYMTTGVPMLFLIDNDYDDNTTIEWMKDIKHIVISTFAVIKLTNVMDERQEVYYRYCEEYGYLPRTVCIVHSKPSLRRYKMNVDIGQYTLVLFIEDWIKGLVPPFLKQQSILDDKREHIRVLSYHIDTKHKIVGRTDE